MIEILLRNTQGVHGLVGFEVVNEVYGIVLYLEISLYYGFNAQEVLAQTQERISARIEEYTSINVLEVNIKARRLVHPPLPADTDRDTKPEAQPVHAAGVWFGAPTETADATDALLPHTQAATVAEDEPVAAAHEKPAGTGQLIAARIRAAFWRLGEHFARR